MSQLKVNSIIPVSGVPTGGGGGITQVISTFKDDTFTTTSNSLVDITGFSLTITPSSNSSKILILSNAAWGNNTNTAAFATFQLVRVVGGTATHIAEPSDTTQSFGGTATMSNPNGNVIFTLNRMAYQFLDSPATTSAVTYKWQVHSDGSAQVLINTRSYNAVMATTSSITAFEVSA